MEQVRSAAPLSPRDSAKHCSEGAKKWLEAKLLIWKGKVELQIRLVRFDSGSRLQKKPIGINDLEASAAPRLFLFQPL